MICALAVVNCPDFSCFFLVFFDKIPKVAHLVIETELEDRTACSILPISSTNVLCNNIGMFENFLLVGFNAGRGA